GGTCRTRASRSNRASRRGLSRATARRCRNDVTARTGAPYPAPRASWYGKSVAAHVIGLTGGIASGKSAVARMLAERGAAVIDADQLARQIVEPGQPAPAELVDGFGAAILTADGQLDRKRLGAIAFADEDARRDLGRITHPRIAAAS